MRLMSLLVTPRIDGGLTVDAAVADQDLPHTSSSMPVVLGEIDRALSEIDAPPPDTQAWRAGGRLPTTGKEPAVFATGTGPLSLTVPGKIAQVGAKVAKAAKNSCAARRARNTIHDLGGLPKAIKAVAKNAKSRGKGLSATNRKRVENLMGLGAGVMSNILGLGGCEDIYQGLK